MNGASSSQRADVCSERSSPPKGSSSGRLLELRAGGAAENMALDQALLESADAGAPVCLRLYSWSEPTLSLGYFQKYSERFGHRESAECGCVRRASGGGAILHHHELTYSLTMTCDGGAAGANLELYRRTHAAISRALSDFGVRADSYHRAANKSPEGLPSFLCFQRRTGEDLIVGGYKVLGSAQRRGRGSILQHGSLLLQASRWAPQLPGLMDLGARAASIEDIADSVSTALASEFMISWHSSQPTKSERDRCSQISRQRFGSHAWLHRR